MSVLEQHRGEIFRVYIAERQSQERVLERLTARGVEISVWRLQKMLAAWRFWRNTKRSEALAGLRLVDEAQVLSPQALGPTRRAPASHEERVTRYWQQHKRDYRRYRAHLPMVAMHASEQNAASPPECLLLLPPAWRPLIEFGNGVAEFIQRQFITAKWLWESNSRLVWSSHSPAAQQAQIMSMIHGADLGCDALDCGAHELAGGHFQRALDAIHALMSGDYHDIIPNVLIKISDVYDRGYPAEAQQMKEKVIEAASAHGGAPPAAAILAKALGETALEQLRDLVETSSELFYKYFLHYLGPYCYNTSAMEITRARRMLCRDPSARLEALLPDVGALDHTFGRSNARPLDVIRTRIYMLYSREYCNDVTDLASAIRKRNAYLQILNETRELTWRAQFIDKNIDPWQHNYYLLISHYYAGLCYCHLRQFKKAEHCFGLVLSYDRAFRRVDRSGQFDGEMMYVNRLLRLLPHGDEQDDDWDWEAIEPADYEFLDSKGLLQSNLTWLWSDFHWVWIADVP